MKLSQKGAALMQVLLVTLVLAGMATMLLRASLSRTTSARKTRRTASAQVLIQSCMAEVQALWGAKTPDAFYRDMQGDSSGPFMYCKERNTNGTCKSGKIERTYTCIYDNPSAANPSATNQQYKVTASFQKDSNNVWRMKYEITQGGTYL